MAIRKKRKTKAVGSIVSNISERFFGGLPIVDADANLHIIVKKTDKKGAIRKDPQRCVAARACRRQFGSVAAVFLRTMAYVDLPNSRGGRVVNRFTLDHGFGKKIAGFDRTGKFPIGGFLLTSPNPSNTLAAKRKRSDLLKRRKLRGESIRPALIKGARKRGKTIVARLDDIRGGFGSIRT